MEDNYHNIKGKYFYQNICFLMDILALKQKILYLIELNQTAYIYHVYSKDKFHQKI